MINDKHLSGVSKTPVFFIGSLFILLLCFVLSCNKEDNNQITDMYGIQLMDDRLSLSLYAEEPDIVTPIGIAVDSMDRIFVLESHTHLPPSDYSGPDGDVIKIFQDIDSDGMPDTITAFAEGFEDGMMMAFSPDGVLYLVTAKAVWALYDHNGDGVSDEQVKVLELIKPESVYPHAALLGITFSHDGWMYVSRGNTGGSEWELAGTDGSTVGGYGDGGNIVRARPDGSQLEEFATGFWNPFDLKFDDKGRLLAADNDPDSRGPNRLIHVIKGGDYGYKSLYGGSGIHPYLAWNGELSGTLPYAAGLGEAPSGLLETNLTALPQDYQDEMLCTIWEESRIVRIRVSPDGASVSGETEIIAEGGQDFRPVAFASDSRGNIYFTDWVLRDYPNHGRGRIWKLSSKPGIDTINLRKDLYAKPHPDPGREKLERIYASDSPDDFNLLKDHLKSDDPFIRHAAITVLSDSIFHDELVTATSDHDPDVRLGAMIAMHRSDVNNVNFIAKRMIADRDIRIRQRALMWIGREGMTDLRSDLDIALTSGPVNEELFETYLATVRHLMPEFLETYKNRTYSNSRRNRRVLPSRFIESFISDSNRPDELRALAVKYIENPEDEADLLLSILDEESDHRLRLEVIRSLASISGHEVTDMLIDIAVDQSQPVDIRSEALLSLARQPVDVSADVIPLLDDPQTDVQIEATRYLRLRLSSEGVREALKQRYAALAPGSEKQLQEQILLAFPSEELAQQAPGRPSSLYEWQEVLASNNGDPYRGRRVFFSVQSTCSSCHVSEGRGGDLGPDLTNAGQSKSRDQLVNSILQPSEEISPEWQGWYIRLLNGDIYQGRQIDVGNNDIDLYTEGQGFVTINKSDIEQYGMAERSLMPEGLESQLTVSDLHDLIAYLELEK